MTVVYGRCHEEIGAFNDTKYIVAMLERSSDRLERDRLIQFLNKLILNKRNVKEIMDANGVKVMPIISYLNWYINWYLFTYKIIS